MISEVFICSFVFTTFQFFAQHMKTFPIFRVKIFGLAFIMRYLFLTVDGTVCAAFSRSGKQQQPEPDKKVISVNVLHV